MVRRSTTGTASSAGRPRGRPRAASGRGGVLGSALAAVSALTALALGALALPALAALPSPAADAPTPCADSRELLVASAVLDRGADALAGHLVACLHQDRRILTIHNRTPVAWALRGAEPSGVVSGTGGVSGLLSSSASRAGRGLVVAPGASASLSAGPGPIAPEPDREATRLFLALTAVVGVQDSARAAAPPRAPRSVVRSAALACAVAVAESGGVLDRAGLAAAADDAVCRDGWRRAQRTASRDGWLLPGLAEALPRRAEVDARLARSASDWFAASRAWSWASVEAPRPEP